MWRKELQKPDLPQKQQINWQSLLESPFSELWKLNEIWQPDKKLNQGKNI